MIDTTEDNLILLQQKVEKENIEIIDYFKEWSSAFMEGYLALKDSCLNQFPIYSQEQLHSESQSLSQTPNENNAILTLSQDSSTSSSITSIKKPNEPHLTIRNNKVVYSLSTKGSRLASNDKDSAEHQLRRGIRGSRYRGVSRNGNQWQVLIMINKKKKYMGNYTSEERAAKVYDQIALRHHGAKAKTNFLYSKEDIETILSNASIVKA